MGKEFAIAEGKRIEITNEQAKQIRDMYKSIEKDFAERIRILSNKSNISSIMREQYLKDFQKDLEDRIVMLNNQLEGTIKDNMLEVAKAVTDDNDKMLRQMGFGGVFTSNYYIPQDAVNSVITGKLYEGKWSLSKAIWSDNQKKLNDINSIVAKGMAENKSTYELAKDLERYVNPNARKDWSWSKVYPGTSKKIDYNAQRLARTMVSHAYQEAFVLNTKDNPFIESYQWLASGSDRMCDLCAERDGQIFAKDELPLDHPNGMCTFMIVKEKSYEEMAQNLYDWVHGTGDSELNEELDKYAETLGYNVKEWTVTTQPVQELTNQLNTIVSLVEEYVSGTGESISEVFADNPEGLDYIRNHMELKSNTFYRLERSQFTAKNLKIGDTFSFNGDLRSFTGSYDGLEEISKQINDFDNLKEYTLFSTVGSQKAFDINKFIDNKFFGEQDEYILGGTFEVRNIREYSLRVDDEFVRVKQIVIS